jgi:type IV secretion system protein VirB8
MARDTGVEAYFSEARGWDADRVALLRASARRAWGIAGIAVVAAVIAMVAVLYLTPLKTVEPYVIRVDNGTGIVAVVPVYRGTTDLSEVIDRHLLTTYVTARERYFYAVAESDYAQVGAMQTAPMNQAWLAAWDRNNAESPLNRYKDGTTVRVQVQSITFLARANGRKDLAQVRFLTAKRMGGAGAEVVTHWIATMAYQYQPPSRDDRQRAMNPIGLRVMEYRREPEVIEPATVANGSAP